MMMMIMMATATCYHKSRSTNTGWSSLLLLLLLSLLTFTTISVYGLGVEDLTNSNGILHYTVNNIKVIDKYYETYHYYKTDMIRAEIDRVKAQVYKYKGSNIYDVLTTIVKNLYSDFNILNSNINPSSSSSSGATATRFLDKQHNRDRRGLINGLGSAISWLTGNMDADDKERYDKIIQDMGTANRQSSINEMNLINTNREMIVKFNAELHKIRSNFIKIQSNLNEMNMAQRSYDFLAHISLLRDKLTELLTSMELCKKQIIHYNIMSDVVESIPKNLTLISRDLNIVRDNTRIFCAFYEDTFHAFVKLPVHERNYKGYLVVPVPFKVKVVKMGVKTTPNETQQFQYKQLDVKDELVIERFVDHYYYGDCFYNQVYYCQNLRPLDHFTDDRDSCLEHVIGHGTKSAACTYDEPTSQLVYNPYLRTYIVYNKTTVVDCNGETIFLPEIAQVNVTASDCIAEFDRIHVHDFNQIFKPTYHDFTLDVINDAINVTVPDFVQVQTVFDEYQLHIIGAGVLALLITIIILVIAGCWCWRRKRRQQQQQQASAPIYIESSMIPMLDRTAVLKKPIYKTPESISLYGRV